MTQKQLHEALGPLAALFEDPQVTEVMVDGPERISVKRQGRIEDTGLRFGSNDEIKAAVQAVLGSVGVEMDEQRSIYDARLTDNSRMLAVLAPTAIHGHSLVFHKWMSNEVSWEKLLEYGSLSQEVRDLIQSAIDAHVSILVAGGTASGKTTLANRIVELIPASERIVSVEQTHEFQFRHPRAVFLEAGEGFGMRMNEVLTAGSKMRPDWLVVGEMQGAEAMRCMQLFSNGHSGITTIHASSVENALSRLEAMCLMANLGLGLDDIREMIASALRLVVYQECLAPGSRRKVTKMAELRGLENGRYALQPLMRYDAGRDVFEMTGVRAGW